MQVRVKSKFNLQHACLGLYFVLINQRKNSKQKSKTKLGPSSNEEIVTVTNYITRKQ